MIVLSKVILEVTRMSDIIELQSEAEWRQAFPVLAILRPELDLETMLGIREDVLTSDFHLYGLMERRRVVCVGGCAVQPHIELGRELYIHDLVTAAEHRSKGHGLNMLGYLEAKAREWGCKRVMLHNAARHSDSRRFYEVKAQYEQYALTYRKVLGY